MRAALSVMIFLAANVLAEDIRHLDDHALEQLENEGLDDSALATELDCPMVDVRIQGSLTGMQPGVLIWEECGEQEYLRSCLIKTFPATFCTRVPACNFWTLPSMSKNNFCYLWSSMSGTTGLPNSISGDRLCSGGKIFL